MVKVKSSISGVSSSHYHRFICRSPSILFLCSATSQAMMNHLKQSLIVWDVSLLIAQALTPSLAILFRHAEQWGYWCSLFWTMKLSVYQQKVALWVSPKGPSHYLPVLSEASAISLPNQWVTHRIYLSQAIQRAETKHSTVFFLGRKFHSRPYIPFRVKIFPS